LSIFNNKASRVILAEAPRVTSQSAQGYAAASTLLSVKAKLLDAGVKQAAELRHAKVFARREENLAAMCV